VPLFLQEKKTFFIPQPQCLAHALMGQPSVKTTGLKVTANNITAEF
jgi:hypothetical protein